MEMRERRQTGNGRGDIMHKTRTTFIGT
jgi:hypothetical protein